jgi:hypothetical protein
MTAAARSAGTIESRRDAAIVSMVAAIDSRIAGADSTSPSNPSLEARSPSVESSVSTSRSSSSMSGIVSDRSSGRSPHVTAKSTGNPYLARTRSMPWLSSGAGWATSKYRCSACALAGLQVRLVVPSDGAFEQQLGAADNGDCGAALLMASQATATSGDVRRLVIARRSNARRASGRVDLKPGRAD